MSTYGSVNHSLSPNGDAGADSSETDTLLPAKNERTSVSQRVHAHLNVEVSKDHADLILLLCYVVTGLLDSCATAVWGSFVSMQTGNTIYFGLGITDPTNSNRWVKAGTSIVCFAFGSFCFSRFHRYYGQRKRWVLLTSFIIQVAMIVAAAIITVLSPKDTDKKHDLHWHVIIPLAIIAFQSSGQAVTSRALKHGSLTSVVLTSIYCDLFSDANLFAWPSENVERNRRAAAPVLLLAGAVFGGLWAKSDFGLAGALWTAAGLKFLIVIAWALWQRDPDSGSDDSNGS